MMLRMPVSCAVPRELAGFAAASSEGAAAVLGAGAVAVSSLQRAGSSGGGVGAAASAAAAVVGAAVPAHARRAAVLGDSVGAVGAAFAAVGTGVDIRSAPAEDVAAWIAEQSANGQLEIPEHWASLVPGVDGCPALNLPVWIRDSDPEGPLAGSLTEPLAAPMQMVCEAEPEERQTTTTWVLDAGGTLIAVPGVVNEARGGRQHRPSGQLRERVVPIHPSQSPVWQAAERYQGRVRRDAQGHRLIWDYTHHDIEVFSPTGRHLGSAHPITGEMYKPPKPGHHLDD